LTAKYRQPFDVLAVAVASEPQRVGEGSEKNGQFVNCLPGMDPNLQPFGHSHCHKLPASAWTCESGQEANWA